ncbi:response regulator [Flavobacterium limnosediminis JC2902]|uniref:Response regulator n=1 Tax=Flavobacterium limnosediminis JC2902 TaxID=1341181 RepID=V6SKY9_9FLAO|nr:LytTR family DNA-binding domain-containing protein [Flavobacterium limnosediminis]ESU27251.1 response regulator [Flavobacterium limnosediminis JC2902]
MRIVNAFIIEHEPETSQILTRFGEDNSLIINTIGNAKNIDDGLELIKRHKPDLIFMNAVPENLNNLKKLNDLDFNTPKLILMSDDMQKAYEAFKCNAVDFILKPLDFSSILISIYKVIKTIEMEISFQNQKLQQIDSINSQHKNNEYIAVASIDKIELLKIDDIIFCKAEGKYTEFTLGNGTKILSSRNLGEYSSNLNENHFFRIHHSYIINIKHVVKISKKEGFYCEFSNGMSLPIAKRRQEEFIKFIKL